MKRSQLKSKYYKNKNAATLQKYKKHKNYCSKLYKKERRNFFNTLSVSSFSDNKTFWKNIQPFFSEKRKGNNKISLVNKEKVIQEDKLVAEEMNDFFKNATNTLNISQNNYLKDIVSISSLDSVDKAVLQYKNHPSILVIKNETRNMENILPFSFQKVKLEEIQDQMKKLNPRKAITFNNIPCKALKNSNECSLILKNIFNDCLSKGEFPLELKTADITPVFKKDDRTQAKNYRPVSVLPIVSKIFERIIHEQLISHFEIFLSPYICGYRKGFSTQQSLISLIEKWKRILDNKGYGGAVLMDLSKAFDTLDHGLLIAKLQAYGVTKASLNLVNSYLSNRWQRTKVNTSFSTWTKLLLGVPQGSVLGPLLFNIYINDIFYVIESTNVCNYADDTTFHACDTDLSNLVLRLEHDSKIAVEWFDSNCMKLNQDKCHLLISGHKHEIVWANIGNSKTWEGNQQKLLGITIDKNLSFDKYVIEKCKKASQKLNALIRICPYLTVDRKRSIMKAFIESQFSYSPLVWMFCGRSSNNRINKLHERGLRVVYDDEYSSFEELLKKDNSVSIHHRNIHILAIELYKLANGLSSLIMQEIFNFRELSYNIRSQTDFSIGSINSVNYGIKSLRYLGPLIWNIIPGDIKGSPNVFEFKKNIKKWIPDGCPCRLCKIYVKNVGYLN